MPFATVQVGGRDTASSCTTARNGAQPDKHDFLHHCLLSELAHLARITAHAHDIFERTRHELDRVAGKVGRLSTRVTRLDRTVNQRFTEADVRATARRRAQAGLDFACRVRAHYEHHGLLSTTDLSPRDRPPAVTVLYERADATGIDRPMERLVAPTPRVRRRHSSATQTDVSALRTHAWAGGTRSACTSPRPDCQQSVSTPARVVPVDISGAAFRRQSMYRHRAIYECGGCSPLPDGVLVTTSTPHHNGYSLPVRVPPPPPPPRNPFTRCTTPNALTANNSQQQQPPRSRYAHQAAASLDRRPSDDSPICRRLYHDFSDANDDPPIHIGWGEPIPTSNNRKSSLFSSLYGSIRRNSTKRRCKSTSQSPTSTSSASANHDGESPEPVMNESSQLYATFRQQLREGRLAAFLRRSLSLRHKDRCSSDGQQQRRRQSVARTTSDEAMAINQRMAKQAHANRHRRSTNTLADTGSVRHVMRHKLQLPLNGNSQVMSVAQQLNDQQQSTSTTTTTAQDSSSKAEQRTSHRSSGYHTNTSRPGSTAHSSQYSLDLAHTHGTYHRGYRIDLPDDEDITMVQPPAPTFGTLPTPAANNNNNIVKPSHVNTAALLAQQTPACSTGSVYSCDQDGYFTSMHLDSGMLLLPQPPAIMKHSHTTSDSGAEDLQQTPTERLCAQVSPGRAWPSLCEQTCGQDYSASSSCNTLPRQTTAAVTLRAQRSVLAQVQTSTQQLQQQQQQEQQSRVSGIDGQLLDKWLLQRFSAQQQQQQQQQTQQQQQPQPQQQRCCYPNRTGVIRGPATANTFYTLPRHPKPSPHQLPCTCAADAEAWATAAR